MNMVSTIDGKIITGERNESVHDLGSDIDHLLMRRLESKADAVLVGGTSLRASGTKWDPETKTRIVVSRSGDLPWDSAFLKNGDPIVLTTEDSSIEAHEGVTILRAGESELDWTFAMQHLKGLGIEVINILGGSVINAQLLTIDLIDEIFMTLAPKVKLGDQTPTIAGGTPLPRHEVKNFSLHSQTAIGSEIFLRYKK
jgi:dihydrofolate reductase